MKKHKITPEFKIATVKLWYALLLLSTRDENTQVSGVIYVIDNKDSPRETLTMYSPGELTHMMKYQVTVHASTFTYVHLHVYSTCTCTVYVYSIRVRRDF